ncbi:DUF3102 domain-containing protein [Pararhizobium sp. BT-229]|uniref:DUF3102 domain-containing protein n=1 Tax=Pararhizobium sp. BT-229 TaxID=2986923 RepID=UPI0021F7A6B8|nr:DUF3102 domain-containing protein [Pararhizobium sp. BT-229]MCV9960357.1 DUF3102 domain-containing protein [Pararhizobium sp. BT-229]
MTQASNRLPVLLETIKNASVVFARAERLSAEAAFDMGSALLEAKSLCEHGEWGDFLEEAGITARSAQRYMRVVNAGFDREELAETGLSSALEEIDAGLALLPDVYSATTAVWENGPHPMVLIFWRSSKLAASVVHIFVGEDGSAGLQHFHDMPVHLFAWFHDLVANGLEGRSPRKEVRRFDISLAERDRRLSKIGVSAHG